MTQGEWVSDGFYQLRPCHQLFHFHDKSSSSDYLTRLYSPLLFVSSPCSTPRRADHSSCTSSSCPSFVLTPAPHCCGDSPSLPLWLSCCCRSAARGPPPALEHHNNKSVGCSLACLSAASSLAFAACRRLELFATQAQHIIIVVVREVLQLNVIGFGVQQLVQ